MGLLDGIVAWISSNESLLSGVAALVAVVGVVVSPIILISNSVNKRRARVKAEEPVSVEPITFRELTAPSPYPVQFADSHGLQIAYNVRGEGEPAIILAPGIISHLHVNSNIPAFRETYALLSSRNRLVGFDKRGQGLSDPSTRAASLAERCSDIEAVMDAAKIKSGVLLGISEAGPMCIQFAHDNPGRIKGLILVGTSARFVEREDYPIGIPADQMNAMSRLWGTGKLRQIFFPSVSEELMSDKTYRAMEMLLASRSSIAELVDTMKQMDVRSLLAGLTVPTLVIHFTGDLAVPARMGRALAEQIPGAQYLEVNSTDHADLSQSPEAINAVWDFCAKL